MSATECAIVAAMVGAVAALGGWMVGIETGRSQRAWRVYETCVAHHVPAACAGLKPRE